MATKRLPPSTLPPFGMGYDSDDEDAIRAEAKRAAIGHGRATTYAVYGCRCDKCCQAQREHMAAYRARKVEPKEHGTISAYTNNGCRCARCRWAWTSHQRYIRTGTAYAPSKNTKI